MNKQKMSYTVSYKEKTNYISFIEYYSNVFSAIFSFIKLRFNDNIEQVDLRVEYSAK